MARLVVVGLFVSSLAACGSKRTVDPLRGDLDGGVAGEECPTGWIRCEGECTDVANDPSNCGRCARECAMGASCGSGVCGKDPVCPEGMVDCGDECRDVSGDPEFCGTCAASGCAADEYCRDGLCFCRPGLLRCGSECVDAQTDPDHCGACGRSCAIRCTDGLCDCGGEACAVDQVCIADGCWDYEPAIGCASCDGCGCPEDEVCCELDVYGTSCVDTRVGCPE